MTRRRWVLRRAGERPLNTNEERKLSRYKRADIVRQWRNDFATLALAERIPPLEQIRVVIVPHYTTRRSLPDTGACSPAAKAAIDGLVDAGVIPNDTPTHVLEHVYRPPRVEGWNGLALIIEEVTEGAAA